MNTISEHILKVYDDELDGGCIAKKILRVWVRAKLPKSVFFWFPHSHVCLKVICCFLQLKTVSMHLKPNPVECNGYGKTTVSLLWFIFEPLW